MFRISAVSREGLRPLTFALARMVEEYRKAHPPAAPRRPVIRPVAVDETGPRIDPVLGVLHDVVGIRAVQAAGYYDLRRVDHAVGYFRQYIRDEQTPRGRFVPDAEAEQTALGEKNFRLLSSAAPPPAGLPSAIIDNSASNVLLNGGNEKLIGQRPAISHRPKKSANEINCQTKGEIGVME